MRLLIDTNIILDYLLNRSGFGKSAKRIIDFAAYDTIAEFISASAVTDILYILQKELKDSFQAQEKISALCAIVSVMEVARKDIERALRLHWKDFEDALQYAVAETNQADYILTRNGDDFEDKKIPVFSPEEFLELFGNG